MHVEDLMKILDNKKLYIEILNASDQHPMVSLQMQIMNIKNKNRENDARAAVEFYSKIIKAKKAEWYYFYRALNYGILNDKKNAIKDYSFTIKKNKNHGSAHYNRGRLYLQSGEYVKAVEDFSAALDVGVDFMSYLSRAEAYFYLNKFDKAKDDFEKAIELRAEFEGEVKTPLTKAPSKKDRK